MSLADLRDDLEAVLLDDLPEPEDPDTTPSPTLADLGDADKALRRIRYHEREMRRIEALADDEIRRISEWRQSELAKRDKRLQWWQATLEGWARAHAAETGTKTVNLPSGKVQLRKAQPLVEWTHKEPGDDVPERFTRRAWVSKTDVKKATKPGPEVDDAEDVPSGYTLHQAVTADGEALPGVVLLVPTQDSFSVRTAE